MTRAVELGARPASTLNLRVSVHHGAARQGTAWRVRLDPPGAPMSPDSLLDLVLSIEPVGTGSTRLIVDGRASRALVSSGAAAPGPVVRLAATALARSLLEQIATALEGQPAANRGVRR